jgi:hypothetical protein
MLTWIAGLAALWLACVWFVCLWIAAATREVEAQAVPPAVLPTHEDWLALAKAQETAFI